MATCCESQATRTYGALPEFIYSSGNLDSLRPFGAVADDTAGINNSSAIVYVNLFVSSVYTTTISASGGGQVTVTQNTTFPVGGDVSLVVAGGPAVLVLRIPSWLPQPTVSVMVQTTAGGSTQSVTGARGSYLLLPAVQPGGRVDVSFPMGLRASVCVERVTVGVFGLCLCSCCCCCCCYCC